MTLAAGRLRHHVTILGFARGQDPDTGEQTEGWSSLYADISAAVEPLSAREFVVSQATQAQITVRITIRYRPGITPLMRVTHRDKTYNIEGVLPDPASGLEYLTLACSEVLGAAP